MNILKKIVLFIPTIIACTLAAGAQQPADSTAVKPSTAKIAYGTLAQQADSAYSQDNFVLAEQLYLKAIAHDGTSSTIFYNLGNAYYRQGNLGKAIVNYERALKLDPTNSDARDNLEFVRAKIVDRQIDEGSIMTTLGNKIVGTFTANAWAWITLVFFALFIAGVLGYFFSPAIMAKKVSFFGGIASLLLCAFSMIVAFNAAKALTEHNHAIILPPSAQLSTTPRQARTAAEEAFLLHEGTKVEVVDSVATSADGKWYEVKVGQRERAWIKASDVERI